VKAAQALTLEKVGSTWRQCQSGWLCDSKKITREFILKDFVSAVNFLKAIADIAAKVITRFVLTTGTSSR
jgi:pterin-4a-carbinolamine dehydratase